MAAEGVSIVTAVRDRLAYLRQVLPDWVAQDLVREVVVVDFGSTAPLAAALARTSPKVRVVRAGEGEPWNSGLALNLGIEAAGCDAVLKLDCDARLHRIGHYLGQLGRDGFVTGYVPMRDGAPDMTRRSCFGQAMFSRRDWDRLGGYHEWMQGWGAEDLDFYTRLEDAGLAHRFFDPDDVAAIPHADAERGGSVPDDIALPLPDALRHNIWFQNGRNKLMAGLAPWHAGLRRPRVFRALGAGHAECVLGLRSVGERRAQSCAAYLAAAWFFEAPAGLGDALLAQLLRDDSAQYHQRAAALTAAGLA
jgi:glycosyltransferase involved in cell wall biosynthesis